MNWFLKLYIYFDNLEFNLFYILHVIQHGLQNIDCPIQEYTIKVPIVSMDYSTLMPIQPLGFSSRLPLSNSE